MRRWKEVLGWTTLVLLFGSIFVLYFPPTRDRLAGWFNGDSFYRWRSSTYWSAEARSLDRQRSKAALAALEEGGPDAVPVLLEMMETADVTQRDAQRLIVRQGKRAVPALGRAVLRKRTRYHAAEVLAKLGPEAKDAVPALRQALLEEPADEKNRDWREVAEALLAIDPDAADRAGLPRRQD